MFLLDRDFALFVCGGGRGAQIGAGVLLVCLCVVVVAVLVQIDARVLFRCGNSFRVFCSQVFVFLLDRVWWWCDEIRPFLCTTAFQNSIRVHFWRGSCFSCVLFFTGVWTATNLGWGWWWL
jgi:hypothetical protein